MIQLFVLCTVINLLIQPMKFQVPEISSYNSDITLKAGETLKLVCPISTRRNNDYDDTNSESISTNNVMYEWKIKDLNDVSITLNRKYSFENNSRVLRITKPVTGDDSGIYVCHGITGFGTKVAKFNIKVIDKNQQRLCAVKKSSDPLIDPPCFVDPLKRKYRDKIVTKEVGDSINLDCQASGTQPMNYLWFHGNTIANWIQTMSGIRGPSLRISLLKTTYTGLYTCQVSNAAGSVNYTYRVIVKESPRNTPRIITQLTNFTYTIGQKAVINVRIECECKKPIIKWLKRVDKSEGDDLKTLVLPNSRPSEKGEDYVTLDAGIIVKKVSEPNIFESQFTIDPVVKGSQGKYIITAINKIVNLKHLEYGVVYINVKSDTKPLEIKNNLVVYIAVPIVILLSSLGVIIYCCLRRHSHNSANNGPNVNNPNCHPGNGHVGRGSRRQYNYGNGNGSSLNGSEKLKSQTSTASTGFPSQQQQQQQQQQQSGLLGNQYPYKYPNNTNSITSNNNNNNNPHITSSPHQSNYDQYSVLSVSHSSNSNQNNPHNTSSLTSNQTMPQYFHNTNSLQYPHQQPYPMNNGYMPLPINQYPA